jgi:hypothetical protein
MNCETLSHNTVQMILGSDLIIDFVIGECSTKVGINIYAHNF